MNRHFSPGMEGDLNGIRWRAVQGRKADADVRLDIRSYDWRSVPMSLGFLFADFFFENENVLYPPSHGYRGGQMYLDYCAASAAPGVGWEEAQAMLLDERARKRAA